MTESKKASSRFKNINRDQEFLQYYTLSILLMKMARFNMDMAKDMCAHSQVKHTLGVTCKFIDSKIADVRLKLKGESNRDVQDDLNSDELQALTSIIHELLVSTNIAEMEKDLVRWIKNIRKVHELV